MSKELPYIYCAGFDQWSFASRRSKKSPGYKSQKDKFIASQTEILIPSQDGTQLELELEDPRLMPAKPEPKKRKGTTKY
jgi:hypothetical protein